MKNTLYILVILSVLFGCKSKQTNTVDIGLLNGPTVVSMIRCIDSTTFHNGENIRYHVKDNPQYVRALLQSDNLDIAMIPMTMAYDMIENNIDIKVFAITGWGNLSIVSREAVSSMNDFAGKTISIPGEGQTPDLVTKFLIERLSLEKKIHLNYTYSSPLLLMGAVSVGKVNSAVLPEPLSSIAINNDPTLSRSIDLAELWSESITQTPLIQTVMVVRCAFIEEHKQWFKSFTPILKENVLWVQDSPQEAIDLAIAHDYIPQSLSGLNVIENSHLDYVDGENMINSVTVFLNEFYDVSDDLELDKYLYND
jgi:NitT/TauT family transport system substrate-binding protein